MQKLQSASYELRYTKTAQIDVHVYRYRNYLLEETRMSREVHFMGVLVIEKYEGIQMPWLHYKLVKRQQYKVYCIKTDF